MTGTRALILVTALTVAGGCAGHAAPTGSAPHPTTTTSAAPVAANPVVSPISVPHSPAVPPVPVLTGIRYAAHEGYDRIVLDIPGAPPGYSVKYVPEVRQDGSDQPVSLPGTAFLLITLHPAQAHTANGTPTVTGTHRTGLPVVQAYAVAGDYEGYVSIALGLDRVRPYHVADLENRIYLDVRTG